MSQIPGDYNPQSTEDWSFNVNPKEPSDLSATGANTPQSPGNVQENSPVQSFGKTAHTEESVLRSAVLSDSLTEAELKKSKWKDAVDTTGRTGRLKYKWNKVKSSMRAFISGFEKRRPVGNLKSRAKNSADSIGMFVKNKTTSSLPTSFSTGNKRETNVSQEMLSLYMDGIELGDLETDNGIKGQESNPVSISTSPLLTNMLINNPVMATEVSRIPVTAASYSTLNSIVDYGQYATFDPSAVESQVLFRRLDILTDSSSDKLSTSFINPKKIVEEEASLEELNTDSEVQQSKGMESGEKTNNSGAIRKKKTSEKSSTNKKQELNKKFQFFKELPPKGLPLLEGGETGAWGGSSHASFRLPQTGHEPIPVVNFSSWGKKNKKFLNSVSSEESISFTDTGFLANSRYLQEVNTGMSAVADEGNNFSGISTEPFLQRNFSKELSMSQRSLNQPNADREGEYLVSSAYSFAGFSGFAAESMQKREEEKLLAEQQKAATSANVLVYQYRTLGLEPPLILRRPSSYASSKRPYIVGKPSAEEAHNEQDQSGDANDGDNVFNNKEKKDE